MQGGCKRESRRARIAPTEQAAEGRPEPAGGAPAAWPRRAFCGEAVQSGSTSGFEKQQEVQKRLEPASVGLSRPPKRICLWFLSEGFEQRR